MHIASPRHTFVACFAAAISLAGVAVAADPVPSATPKTKAVAPSQRAPDATERAAMLEVLKSETAPERMAWFSFTTGSSEGKALADALAAIFREGGWKAEVNALSGLRLKPGVSMLIAEEEAPGWVDSALRAMQASGIDVKSASGYRSYFEDKKKENASWPGVPLPKDAAFVIVLGPEAKG
jgi:hypothetical protein